LLQDVLKFIQNTELTEKFAKAEYFEIITQLAKLFRGAVKHVMALGIFL